jgi:hypothetical protein
MIGGRLWSVHEEQKALRIKTENDRLEAETVAAQA